MDTQLQSQTIQLLVEQSATVEAKAKYAGQQGVFLEKSVADQTFKKALKKKFSHPKTAKLLRAIEDIEKKLT